MVVYNVKIFVFDASNVKDLVVRYLNNVLNIVFVVTVVNLTVVE